MGKKIEDDITESKARNEEIDKQIQTYLFQTKVIFYQVAISVAFLFAGLFLGAKFLLGGIAFLSAGVLVAIVIAWEYVKVYDIVVSRGLRITLDEFKEYRKLIHSHKDWEAQKFLNSVIINREFREAEQLKNHKELVRLISNVNSLIIKRNLAEAEVQEILKINKLPQNYYSMTQAELETMIKTLKSSRTIGNPNPASQSRKNSRA